MTNEEKLIYEDIRNLNRKYNSLLGEYQEADSGAKDWGSEYEKLLAELGANSGSVDNVGTVDTVKKVDEAKIADEDLRFFKEVMDIQAINMFQSKYVVPQVNVTFGNVMETADVNEIIEKINAELAEEVATSADGAWVLTQ